MIETGESEAGAFINHLLEKAYEIKSPTAKDKERAIEKQRLNAKGSLEGERRCITLKPGERVRYTQQSPEEQQALKYEEIHNSPPPLEQPQMNFAPAGHENKKRSEMALAQQRRDAQRKAAERDRRRANAAREQREGQAKRELPNSGVDAYTGEESWPQKPVHNDSDAVLRSPSPPTEEVISGSKHDGGYRGNEAWPEKPIHGNSDRVVRSPLPPEIKILGIREKQSATAREAKSSMNADSKAVNEARKAGKTYILTLTPGETVGRALKGSGQKAWNGLEDAQAQALGLGYEIGVDCRYFQSAGGFIYFYADGSSSGEAGDECWRADPIEEYAEEASELAPLDKNDPGMFGPLRTGVATGRSISNSQASEITYV